MKYDCTDLLVGNDGYSCAQDGMVCPFDGDPFACGESDVARLLDHAQPLTRSQKLCALLALMAMALALVFQACYSEHQRAEFWKNVAGAGHDGPTVVYDTD